VRGPPVDSTGGWGHRRFCVIDVPSREEVLEWAAKTAAACRCTQEVPEVWNKLLAGLSGRAGIDSARRWGCSRRRTKARQRLGPEVMAGVLEAVMTPLTVGPDEAPWAYFHRLRVLAVDGFTMNVAKTLGNVAAFGMRGNGAGVGAYPQVRVVALAEAGNQVPARHCGRAPRGQRGDHGPQAVAPAGARRRGGR
jgi:hypothetical protein